MKEVLPILDFGVISSGWNLSRIKSLMQPRTHPLKIPSTVAYLAYSETVYYIVVPCRCVILHAAANESDPQKSKPWSLRFRRRYKNIEEYTIFRKGLHSTILTSQVHEHEHKHEQACARTCTRTYAPSLARTRTRTHMYYYVTVQATHTRSENENISLFRWKVQKEKSRENTRKKGRRSKKPPPRKVE